VQEVRGCISNEHYRFLSMHRTDCFTMTGAKCRRLQMEAAKPGNRLGRLKKLGWI
jgi:hypothetical protein